MNQLMSLLPKAELHVHLIGTLTPQTLMQFAQRNKISLPYAHLHEIEQAYRAYTDLASFFDLYNQFAHVMHTEQDFYELLYTYLYSARKQGVIYAEVFFEVQTHITRGITFQEIIKGLDNARNDAQQTFGIECELVLCFIRDFSLESALDILEQSTHFKDKIIGIGLAGNEQNNPPSHFTQLYQQAKAYGYKTCIHAGEESGPEYMWQAIQVLHVDRIAHGIACTQDPQLLSYLIESQLPLTVCPLSNIRLNLFDSLKEHPFKKCLRLAFWFL